MKVVLRSLLSVVVVFLLSSCDTTGEDLKNPENQKGSIFGVVTDFATGEPVANANVQLRPGGETTLTGYDGTYEFLDVPSGKYSIIVTKAEYSDLIDDYIITVKGGKKVRRDVQIEKLPTSIRITDMNGNDISSLDFGSNESVVSKSFNIFNNGTVAVTCKVIYSCGWISSISSIPGKISPGQTVPVIVTIDRSLLPRGDNYTNLIITTDNGSAELTLKAASEGGNAPVVSISPILKSDVTATSVRCEGNIVDEKGGRIKDAGFCLSTSQNPTLNDRKINLGPSTGSFSYKIENLEPDTEYHIRAFAVSDFGTAYSSDVSFRTLSGLPICEATVMSDIAGSRARATSAVYSTDGYRIQEGGFCWSKTRNPTIDDEVRNTIYPEGEISMLIYPLQFNTTYWIRSYAISEMGVTYGPEMEFKTAKSDF